jgi:uncharacterized protein YjdB
MKKKGKILGFLWGVFMLLTLGLVAGNNTGKAAEVQITPNANMSSAPELTIGTTYYATMNNYSGYVSFVTPSDGGYVTVYYKNISISDYPVCYVKTATEEVLASENRSRGSSWTKEFRSEPGKRNDAELEPNTRYYIQVGSSENSGNVLFSVSFVKDANPDGKEQAEEVKLNTSYTRSIDAADKEDCDYFKFTTGKGGGHRFTLSQSKTGSDEENLDWYIRKWSTDELAKQSNGNDASGYVWRYDSSSDWDISLEANTTYYLKISSKGIKNYTFSINNQSVTSISIPASKTLAAGESFSLNPTISPDNAYNKSVTYSSSNSDIAYVNSDGTVSASSSNYGTATITVAAQDGSGVTATCKVTVIPPAPSTPYVSSYGTNRHTIKWDSQSGASGYVVYVKSGKSWKKLATTTGTSYTRTKLKGGQKCQYRIRSYINDGGTTYSAYSGTCYAATAPSGKVKKIKVKKSRKKSSSWSGKTYYAKVSWKSLKGATKYRVYYRYPGSKTLYSLSDTSKRSKSVTLYKSKYGSGSKVRFFYVKPILTYHGVTYEGSISKSKKYRFH